MTGARLTLKFDEPLDRSSAPAARVFKVTVAGESRDLAMVAVTGSRVALKLVSPVVQGESVTVSYAAPTPGTAEPIQDPAGNETTAFSNQAVTNRAGEETEAAGRNLSARTVRQIHAILAAKARRTPAQKKVSSELLDARRMAGGVVVSEKAGSWPAPGPDPMKEPVTVDIRADVTPQVLKRIRTLGGTVINSFPKYRSIRARLPLGAVETLAELDDVKSIRTADKAFTRGSVKRRLKTALRNMAADMPATPQGEYDAGRRRPPGECGAQHPRCRRNGYRDRGACERGRELVGPASFGRSSGPRDGAAGGGGGREGRRDGDAGNRP